MLVRITVMVLRISAILALILGILFWFNVATTLIPIHMLLGIIVTLSLWVLGGAIATTKGGIGLAIGAFVLGLLVIGLGVTQQGLLVGSLHWIIQVLHLLFGLAAIGMGEAIGGRYKRLDKIVVAN
ncbi:MAG: hypothetical protein JO123_10625 [Ktedonobacteraceae bacterium]|nr:hypothetical protein [Ktedonobacteraceae bacterium]